MTQTKVPLDVQADALDFVRQKVLPILASLAGQGFLTPDEVERVRRGIDDRMDRRISLAR